MLLLTSSSLNLKMSRLLRLKNCLFSLILANENLVFVEMCIMICLVVNRKSLFYLGHLFATRSFTTVQWYISKFDLLLVLILILILCIFLERSLLI